MLDNNIKFFLRETITEKLYKVKDMKMIDDIPFVEKKHPQCFFNQIKIAVILVREKQTVPVEWFGNREPTDNFQHFLNKMGNTIK
jgi:hypothetical protein